MNIKVLKSSGIGKTKKTAYDDALKNVNLHNYNIITLSSVIPPGSNIDITESFHCNFSVGDVIYAVQSKNFSSTNGSTIASGLAWCMEKNENGGIFLENKAPTKKHCEENLRDGIDEMKENRVNMNFEDQSNVICIEEKVQDDKLYVCVLVIGVYDRVNSFKS